MPRKFQFSPKRMQVIQLLMQGFKLVNYQTLFWWEGFPKRRPPGPRYDTVQWLVEHQLVAGSCIDDSKDYAVFVPAFPSLDDVIRVIETEIPFSQPICKVINAYLVGDHAEGIANEDSWIYIGVVVKPIKGMSAEELNDKFADYTDSNKLWFIWKWKNLSRNVLLYFFYRNDPSITQHPYIELLKRKVTVKETDIFNVPNISNDEGILLVIPTDQ